MIERKGLDKVKLGGFPFKNQAIAQIQSERNKFIQIGFEKYCDVII